QWAFFIDYDPLNNAAPAVDPQSETPDLTFLEGGVWPVAARVRPPASLSQCHTLEFVVGRTFSTPHSPAAPGGDSVVWFFNPEGDSTGCPIFDNRFLDASDGATFTD